MHDIEKTLNVLGYNIIFNSDTSNRGVAILWSKKLDLNIIETKSDNLGNFLVINCTIKGTGLTIAGVYGPNQDNLEFFTDLKQAIRQFNNNYTILGGDWNLTWDTSPIELNLDTINMRELPSHRRSEKLREIARDLKLQDPFRTLYPEKQEFTYVPAAIENLNRSRIDFFLVSENIIPNCLSCTIPHSLSSTDFDHKRVHLHIGVGKHSYNRQTIKDCFLKDELLNHLVHALVYDCYINHSQTDGVFTADLKTMLSGQIGFILHSISNLQQKNIDFIERPDDAELLAETNTILNQIKISMHTLPDVGFFENLTLTCSPDVFF